MFFYNIQEKKEINAERIGNRWKSKNGLDQRHGLVKTMVNTYGKPIYLIILWIKL